MELRLVETFVEAAKRGSFSGAARHLGVSPAAVSQNIKSLEEHLQARLFTRTTRSVRLTPEGERYFQRCAPALSALSNAAEALADEREEMQGWIRISCTTAFGRAEIIPLLEAFMRQHPGVRVELVLADAFVDLVSEGFDFAIRGGILPVNDYVSRLLLPVTPMVVASPDYAERHGLPTRIDQVQKHACIGMRANSTQRLFSWEFKQAKLPFKVDIEPRFVVNDPEGLARAAAAGLGLAQVGSNVALPMLRAGVLTTALEPFVIQSRGLYAVYPSRRYVPRRVSELISLLVESFASRVDLLPTGRASRRT